MADIYLRPVPSPNDIILRDPLTADAASDPGPSGGGYVPRRVTRPAPPEPPDDSEDLFFVLI